MDFSQQLYEQYYEQLMRKKGAVFLSILKLVIPFIILVFILYLYYKIRQ